MRKVTFVLRHLPGKQSGGSDEVEGLGAIGRWSALLGLVQSRNYKAVEQGMEAVAQPPRIPALVYASGMEWM